MEQGEGSNPLGSVTQGDMSNRIMSCVLGDMRSLPTFDMRNGDVAEVTPVLIKATIGVSFHWVPVEDMPPQMAVHNTDAYIRSHLHHLTMYRPAGMNEAQIRKAAIVLGTIRATATTYYRLLATDFIAGERRSAYLRYHAAEAGVNEVTYSLVNTGDSSPALIENFAATTEELHIIADLVKCGLGVLPMQGYSLVMCGHHYLSEAGEQARKIFAVAERAYWKSNVTSAWVDPDKNMIQDLCWHKATHPVKIEVKIQLAMDSTIGPKLRAADAGACASRLPAVESALRAANSYLTLFATVRTMFEGAGGAVMTDELEALVALVKSIPYATQLSIDNAPEYKGRKFTNRADALAALEDMIQRNSDTAAFCYGFYTALSDNSITLGGANAAVTDTLKASNSLGKLKTSSFASYVEGTSVFADYQAYKSRQRMEGKFAAPQLTIV